MYMPLLINGIESVDLWVALDIEAFSNDAQAAINAAHASGQAVIYPIAVYVENRQLLNSNPQQVGLFVTGDDDWSELVDLFDEVSLIAIEFPVLRDGRGFSIARDVSRRGFKGEIRAVGDVAYDRLDSMLRSGFNAFQVSDDRYTDDTHKAFTEMTVNYQPTHLR